MDPDVLQAALEWLLALYGLVRGHARDRYLSESETSMIVEGYAVFATFPYLRTAAQEGKYDYVIAEIIRLGKESSLPQPEQPAEPPETLKMRNVGRQSTGTSKFDGPNIDNFNNTIEENEDKDKSGGKLHCSSSAL